GGGGGRGSGPPVASKSAAAAVTARSGQRQRPLQARVRGVAAVSSRASTSRKEGPLAATGVSVRAQATPRRTGSSSRRQRAQPSRCSATREDAGGASSPRQYRDSS